MIILFGFNFRIQKLGKNIIVDVENIFERKITLTPVHFVYDIWRAVISKNKKMHVSQFK